MDRYLRFEPSGGTANAARVAFAFNGPQVGASVAERAALGRLRTLIETRRFTLGCQFSGEPEAVEEAQRLLRKALVPQDAGVKDKRR
jgi:hypothetical protein